MEDIKEELIELPPSFQPNSSTVVVGRGRKIYDLEGNKRMRGLVKKELQSYFEADKTEKSYILMRLLRHMKKTSEHAFVKQDTKTGSWFELPDSQARITLAQAFRDALFPKYRSSKFNKQCRRLSQKKVHHTREVIHVPPPSPPSPVEVDCFPGFYHEAEHREDPRSFMTAYCQEYAFEMGNRPKMTSGEILSCISSAVATSEGKDEILAATKHLDFTDSVDMVDQQMYDETELPGYFTDPSADRWFDGNDHRHQRSNEADPFEPVPFDEAMNAQEDSVLGVLNMLPVSDIQSALFAWV